MRHLVCNRSGFTLVEILIVVIILGILAAVAIPQFSGSTDDARLTSLDTSLTQVRNAIELYYHQHSNVYPGAKNYSSGTNVASASEADTSFVKQLTLFSDIGGRTASTKNATFKYGPYLKTGMPTNPYSDLSTVKCDIVITDITAAVSDASTGWRFYTLTGRFIANDGAHDAN